MYTVEPYRIRRCACFEFSSDRYRLRTHKCERKWVELHFSVQRMPVGIQLAITFDRLDCRPMQDVVVKFLPGQPPSMVRILGGPPPSHNPADFLQVAA